MPVKVPMRGMPYCVDGSKGESLDHTDQYGALEDGFKESYSSLFNQALRIVRTADAADDVVQEAFVNTMAAIERGERINNVGGWMNRCVHNSSMNYVRQYSRKQIPMKDNFELVDPDSLPELAYAKRRYNKSLCKAIDKLTPAQQSVFVLSDVKGLKQREIASTLKCSENSVSQLLSRARGHVRKEVGSKRFAAVPILWLLCRTYKVKQRCHAYYQSTSVKATHLHTSTSTFVQRSAEMIGQPTAALVAGAVVVVAITTSDVDKKNAASKGGESASQAALATTGPLAEVSPSSAVEGEEGKESSESESAGPASAAPFTGGGSIATPGVGHGDSKSNRQRVEFPTANTDTGSDAVPAGGSPGTGTSNGGSGGARNGKIVFVANNGGNFEVYSMNADGSGVVNMTNNASADVEPSWSGDGSKVSFTSLRDGNAEVYTMNADGSGQTRLTNNPATDNESNMSWGGSKIGFRSNRDGNNEAYVMNADGSGETRMTNDPDHDGGPSWSPDGFKLTFSSDRDDPWSDIYAMSSSGGPLSNLTNSPGTSEVEPAWSPGGTKIAFETQRDGNDEIYIMNVDGSGQTRLTNNPASDESPIWSPDGTKIAFKSDRDGNREIYVMNADGSGETNVSQTPTTDEYTPVWQAVY